MHMLFMVCSLSALMFVVAAGFSVSPQSLGTFDYVVLDSFLSHLNRVSCSFVLFNMSLGCVDAASPSTSLASTLHIYITGFTMC